MWQSFLSMFTSNDYLKPYPRNNLLCQVVFHKALWKGGIRQSAYIVQQLRFTDFSWRKNHKYKSRLIFWKLIVKILCSLYDFIYFKIDLQKVFQHFQWFLLLIRLKHAQTFILFIIKLNLSIWFVTIAGKCYKIKNKTQYKHIKSRRSSSFPFLDLDPGQTCFSWKR